jgi:hypothetical protein
MVALPTEIAIAGITGTKGRGVAVALLLSAAVGLAWGAHGIAAPRREMAALARQLPDLPALHSATRHRDLRFPVTRWAHRVNSVQRARMLGPEYRGLEIDLVYDMAADRFDVGHPPVPSAGISLEQVLAVLPEAGDRYYWLDFKNLTPANAEPGCWRSLGPGRSGPTTSSSSPRCRPRSPASRAGDSSPRTICFPRLARRP